MTELIQEQLKIMLIMGYCGLTAGLIIDVFRLFVRRFCARSKIMKVVMQVICCLVLAFLIGDFSYYCQNGRLTFLGGTFFLLGLWLWHKIFCGRIIVIGDKHEQEGEKAP